MTVTTAPKAKKAAPAKAAAAAKAATPAKPAAKAAPKAAPAKGLQAKGGNGGFPDLDSLGSAAGMAAQLTEAANSLATALESGHFCDSLDRNLQLWTAIKSVLNGDGTAELRNLADQVTTATLAIGRSFNADTVAKLVGINLEVARGLVDGVLSQLVRDRAYYLWLEAGAQHGNDQHFWLTAEREIRDLL
jgi:hypothetical protein